MRNHANPLILSILLGAVGSAKAEEPAAKRFAPASPADGKTVIASIKPQLVVQSGHQGRIHSAAISPDGKFLATGAESIILWDVRTARILRKLYQPSDALAFDSDSKRLASTNVRGTT